MTKHLPKAERLTVAPANHQGLVERHKEVNEGAERFIKKLGEA
jgi:hypothetical protein